MILNGQAPMTRPQTIHSHWCKQRMGCTPRQRGGAAHAAATTQVAAARASDIFPPDVNDITDPYALAIIARVTQVSTTVPGVTSDVRTAIAGPTAEELERFAPETPAVIMIHAFDSSLLEFRRLYPLISMHLPTYAIDLVGGGFTDHSWMANDPETRLGPALKRAHLKAFIEQHLAGRPVILLGTSLGGAVAVDMVLNHPEMVKGLILCDPQVFIDGIGPMAKLPRFAAEWGVKVLQAKWLRDAANKAVFHDKATFATQEAMRVGRLHTLVPGWLDANVAFMQSGGYSVSRELQKISTPTLVLWGRQDAVLGEYTSKVSEQLPTSKLVFVDDCGHLPHLEQAGVVAREVLAFVNGEGSN